MPGAESPPAGESEARLSTWQSVQALLRELPGLVSDRVHLLALELRRAGVALAQMVALVVAAAVLLVTAWLALWVGLAAGAIQAGMPWGWVLVVVLVINVGAAAAALLRARALAALLMLPATLRHLTVARTPEEPPARPPAPPPQVPPAAPPGAPAAVAVPQNAYP